MAQDNGQNPSNQLNIEIGEDIAEGVYANLAIITHGQAEFILDFVNIMPGTPKSRVKARVVVAPVHAKRLLRALAENLQKFEAENGIINDVSEIDIPFNFGGPTAQA